MGVRLALHSLSTQQQQDDVEEDEEESTTVSDKKNPPLLPIQSLFMIGAAIPSNAFNQQENNNSNDNSWNVSNLFVKRIYNFYSINDSVLSSAYTWAEAMTQFSLTPLLNKDSRAMGSIGMGQNIPSSDQISSEITINDIDISDEVPTHSVHAYLASPRFQVNVVNELHSEI